MTTPMKTIYSRVWVSTQKSHKPVDSDSTISTECICRLLHFPILLDRCGAIEGDKTWAEIVDIIRSGLTGELRPARSSQGADSHSVCLSWALGRAQYLNGRCRNGRIHSVVFFRSGE